MDTSDTVWYLVKERENFPASYPMGTSGYFPGGKAAGA